jgi:hypothetical protein
VDLHLGEEETGISVSQTRLVSLHQFDRDTGIHERTHRIREFARQWIALIVVGSLAFIVVCSFISLWKVPHPSIDEVIKIIEAIISPVIGIVGAVTGFYFGESQRVQQSSQRTNDVTSGV